MSSDIYSFYDLIEKYTITIPVIQRAYAEGRNTKQAEDVRKSITAAIINAVTEGKALFFDFVYGNIEEKKFIPFDGQQRLTTLFLFHRYVFEVAGESMDLLKKFTYKTRPSSSEFIEKLCENNIIPKDGIALSEYLTNQNWFFDDWKKDPTISSMLVVLDEIHWQISSRKNIDFKKILDGLKTSKLITFHFVNMKENKLPAATYIKMNARGKSLTAFENFKASLEEYLNEKDAKLSARLKENIDSKWLDLFYNRTKEREQKLPDASLMAFFNRHFVNIWNLQDDSKSIDENMKSKIESDLVSFPEIDTFISWDVYKTILDNCKADEFFIPLFNFLDALKDNEGIETVKDYDKNWTWLDGSKNKANETYPSRVKFYAWLVYFRCEQYEEISFKNWMRVAFNIIENQTIDSQDSYKGALNLIKELSEHSHRIYEYLAYDSNKIESNFASEQVAEEIAKAHKIVSDKSENWEQKFIEAENHAFFKGAIRFLFRDEEGNFPKWKQYDDKWENTIKYFDRDGVSENYRKKAIVLRYFISQFDDWGQFWKYSYDNSSTTWIELLKLKKFSKPIHSLLTKEISVEYDFSQYESKLKDMSDMERMVQNDLVKTRLLEKISDKQPLLHWYGQKYFLYPYNKRKDELKWLVGDKRNYILAELVKKGVVSTEQQIEDCDFFYGWGVEFKYKEKRFKWDGDDKFFVFNTKGEWVKDTKLSADALRKLTTEAKK